MHGSQKKPANYKRYSELKIIRVIKEKIIKGIINLLEQQKKKDQE